MMLTIFRREFALYVAVSACALGADMAILTLLVRSASVHYIAAASVSFIVGAIVSYCLCIKVVFEYRRLTSTVPEFGIFALIGALGIGLNAVAMLVGVEVLEQNLFVSKIGAAGLTFMLNFVLRKTLLFTRTDPLRVLGSTTRQGKP